MKRAEVVGDAVHTLIRMWPEWEADANQQAQQQQDNEAYFGTMTPQVEAVVGGMLDDVLNEVRAVLANMDNLAQVWGDEGVFRSCRDRLRALTN
jgi:hypothetical protein